MMSYQQPVRTLCLDCATPFFASRDDIEAGTRCTRCLRRYKEQLYLLLDFSLRWR
jgi:DNA-directed RNA polymerase subunit RPC12/RpoP